MSILEGSRSSDQAIFYELPNGKTCVQFSWISILSGATSSGAWLRGQLQSRFSLPDTLGTFRGDGSQAAPYEGYVLIVEQLLAAAHPASIGMATRGSTAPFGFAVDSVRAAADAGQKGDPDNAISAKDTRFPDGADLPGHVYADIAVSGNGSWIARVAFEVTAIGTMAWRAVTFPQ
jgi:hypothetical protein